MSKSSEQKKRVTLGDDGELHQRLDNPAYSDDAIFCIHCAAPNYPGSKYCNECGGSLVEQQELEPGKEKHTLTPQTAHAEFSGAVFAPLPDEIPDTRQTSPDDDDDETAPHGLVVAMLAVFLVVALLYAAAHFPSALCIVGAIAVIAVGIVAISSASSSWFDRWRNPFE